MPLFDWIIISDYGIIPNRKEKTNFLKSLGLNENYNASIALRATTKIAAATNRALKREKIVAVRSHLEAATWRCIHL